MVASNYPVRSTHAFTDVIAFVNENYPSEIDLIRSTSEAYGFESLELWAATGDKFAMGMGIAQVRRVSIENFNSAKELTSEQLAERSEAERMTLQFLQSLSEAEIAFYDSNLDRGMELLEGI